VLYLHKNVRLIIGFTYLHDFSLNVCLYIALSIKDLCMPVAIRFRMFVYKIGTSVEVQIKTAVLIYVRCAYKSVLRFCIYLLLKKLKEVL
jgi:hypothetical protein